MKVSIGIDIGGLTTDKKLIGTMQVGAVIAFSPALRNKYFSH